MSLIYECTCELHAMSYDSYLPRLCHFSFISSLILFDRWQKGERLYMMGEKPRMGRHMYYGREKSKMDLINEECYELTFCICWGGV